MRSNGAGPRFGSEIIAGSTPVIPTNKTYERMTLREKKTLQQKQRRKRKREWLTDYKLERGCKKCGGDHESHELHLHHVDPKRKTIKPTRMVNEQWSEERMLKELEHCIVLCEVCHREEHRRPAFGLSGTFIE